MRQILGRQHMEARALRGLRDYLPAEAARRESIAYNVGQYYARNGYGLIETPVLEGLDVMQTGLSGEADNSFRFVDIDGRLMALRTDITVPIARVVATRFDEIEGPYRLRYCADVFREEESLRGQARQLTQLGIEFIGAQGAQADAEVIRLALEGLNEAGINQAKLHLGHAGVFTGIASFNQPTDGWGARVCEAAHQGDFIRVRSLCEQPGVRPEVAHALTSLISLRGQGEALESCDILIRDCGPEAQDALAQLRETYALLTELGLQNNVVIDFSIMREFEYYTGVIFEIYSASHGRALGGGGRYDRVLSRFGRDLPAAGFALELDCLVEAVALGEVAQQNTSKRLRVAIPKGSLYKDSVAMLGKVGFDVTALQDPGRQLRITTAEADFLIAKPTDVAIYVATGAADCGIGGRDILVEADFPLLELVDLKFGECKFVVAQPEDDTVSLSERALAQGVIRVATKYPRLAASFFEQRGIQADMVKLNGNIELAPLIGIADVIVDITATGTTLRENNLQILEDVLPSTARFVANQASARTKPAVYEIAARLYDTISE